MATLFSLPDEVLVEIIRYINLDHPTTSLDFYCWACWYKLATECGQPSGRVKTLHALLRSCRRLSNLVEPFFYRDVLVSSLRSTQTKFYHTLEQNPRLRNHLRSAIVHVGGSIYDAYSLFWHNSRTLTLIEWKDWDAMEFDDYSHIGTSPVTRLNLIACGAKEEALAAVLAWPEALESLHYDADQGEWDGHYEDEPVIEWTCAAFVRALESQKKTLRELTMTRPPLDHEGLGQGPRIDLHGFAALTTLRIYHVFLCGFQDPWNTWRGLPPHLEVLEVYYDDAFYIDLFEGYSADDGEWSGGRWLLELLAHKKTDLPELSKVTIWTAEPEPRSDSESDAGSGEDRNMFAWTLPEALAEKCKSAAVDLTVWLQVEAYPEMQCFDALAMNAYS